MAICGIYSLLNVLTIQLPSPILVGLSTQLSCVNYIDSIRISKSIEFSAWLANWVTTVESAASKHPKRPRRKCDNVKHLLSNASILSRNIQSLIEIEWWRSRTGNNIQVLLLDRRRNCKSNENAEKIANCYEFRFLTLDRGCSL